MTISSAIRDKNTDKLTSIDDAILRKSLLLVALIELITIPLNSSLARLFLSRGTLVPPTAPPPKGELSTTSRVKNKDFV